MNIVEDETDGVKNKIEKYQDSLLQQSEFAALCSFIHHFGTDLGIYLTFPQLEQFLRLEENANWRNWETLHIKLLNKLKYRARPERWEPVLGRFLINHGQSVASLEEAGECLVTGVCPKSSQNSSAPITRPFSPVYYGLDPSVRIRLLLVLLESQFDRNQGFKDKVNLRSALDLRFRPLGYDVWGRVYWLLKDSEINLLLYREDNVKESFQLICQTTDEMRSVRTQLENACPDSVKLSEILTNREGSPNPDSAIDPASPSTMNKFKELVRTEIPSTEVEVRSPEPPLTNGDVFAEIAPHMPQTNLSVSFVQIESANVMNAKASSLPDVKPELLQSADENVLPISASTKIQPDHTSKDAPTKCDPVDKSLSPPPHIKSEHESTNDSDMKIPDEVKQEDMQQIKEDENVGSDKVISITKSKKRGRAPKVAAGAATESVSESTTHVEVRRSGRMRKPVEFLTMEPPQPKRPRHSIKPQSATLTAPTDLNDSLVKKHRSKRSKITPNKVSGDAIDEKSENTNESGKRKRRRRKKRKRGHGRKKTASAPWLNHTSSSDSDAEDDTFERALLEHEQSGDDSSADLTTANEALDWLDQPESDFNPDELASESDVDSLTQGRNFARQKRLERMRSAAAAERQFSNPSPDETCQVCGKSHMPEWILLCDRCDRGHHAMCLCPPLYVIPEGDWFCPRCQHMALLQALAECADQIDAEQKKQTIWRRMQERLNFVNISMTNILANDDEEESRLSTRRRARRNAIVYRDSESSRDFEDDDVDDRENDELDARTSQSASQCTSTGGSESDSRDGFRRRTVPRRRAAKQARLLNGLSSRRRGQRTTTRSKWISDSEEEDEFRTDSSSGSTLSPPPPPRTARQRPIQYDLGVAFKQLDEALEDDEKYQEEKRRRRDRKLSRLATGSGGSAVDASPNNRSPESGPSPGRSHGKDLSNILGPDWKDDLDSAPVNRLRTRKRHRVAGTLSSSSSETDPDHATTVFDGRRKRSADNEDKDFQPSGSSEEQSNLSCEEEEEESLESESDSSWMCVARQQRRKTGGSRRKARRSGGQTRRPRSAPRRRARPLPRFEQSEDEEVSEIDDRAAGVHKSSHGHLSARIRPRRCARAVVSYRESDDQEEDESHDSQVDLDSTAPIRLINRRRLVSSSDEEQGKKKDIESSEDIDHATVIPDEDDRPPTPVRKSVKVAAAGRRKRVLSSDSEYQPDEEKYHEQSDEEEEASTTSEQQEPQDTQIDESTSPDLRRLDKSHVFDQTPEPSDVGSPTALRITESSSPEPSQPLVAVDLISPVKQQSIPQLESDPSRDKSIVEDAEDLLPRHTCPTQSTEIKPATPITPLPLSPDLFG